MPQETNETHSHFLDLRLSGQLPHLMALKSQQSLPPPHTMVADRRNDTVIYHKTKALSRC